MEQPVLEDLEQVGPIACFDHAVAVLVQDRRDESALVLVIVGDKDAGTSDQTGHAN